MDWILGMIRCLYNNINLFVDLDEKCNDSTAYWTKVIYNHEWPVRRLVSTKKSQKQIHKKIMKLTQ